MLTRRDQTAEVADRPFNNLLRRLNPADYALLAPHLTSDETKQGELLYNPGDNVQIVHFPCGPTLASYMVPSEDGRDVETVLIGREGAVGGIVSHGFLPAYTRIAVKFSGPFARLPIAKLEAAKAKSATLRNIFARYADCMLAQIFQSTACNAVHSIEQRTAKWIISAMERADGSDTGAADARAARDAARRRALLCQPGDPDLQAGWRAGNATRFDPGARPRCSADARLPLQRVRQEPFWGSAARRVPDGRAGARRVGLCLFT